MQVDEYAKQATQQLISRLRDQGIRDERVLAAMSRIDRAAFMDPELASAAYADEPQSIGHGQTISQPFVVARMTEALELKGSERVLEVGVGSGYQTAVLAQLCRDVFGVEIIPSLFQASRERIKRLGLKNVHLALRSGEFGWPEAAPFDGILVAAAPAQIPQPLVEQLAPGGRLIIPVGGGDSQTLIRATREADTGELHVERLLSVRFVPLVPAPPSA